MAVAKKKAVAKKVAKKTAKKVAKKKTAKQKKRGQTNERNPGKFSKKVTTSTGPRHLPIDELEDEEDEEIDDQ